LGGHILYCLPKDVGNMNAIYDSKFWVYRYIEKIDMLHWRKEHNVLDKLRVCDPLPDNTMAKNLFLSTLFKNRNLTDRTRKFVRSAVSYAYT